MRIGLSLPARTFMPEESKQLDSSYNAFDNLIYGYNTAKSLGYDYIEAAVGAVNELSKSEFEELKRMIREGKFFLQICNCFIPTDMKLFEVPFEKVSEFVENSMHRMSELGVKTVVFGSGAARMRPEDTDILSGTEFLKKFLSLCSDIGKKYDIETSLENLNNTETNLINTVSEGAGVVRELNKSNILLLADAFHMSIENENYLSVSKNSDIISHFHISEAPGRVFPGKFKGAYLLSFIDYLKLNEIDKDITVECVFDDFESEAKSAIEFLKERLQ